MQLEDMDLPEPNDKKRLDFFRPISIILINN